MRIAVFIIVILMLPVTASADYAAGLKAFEAEDYATAYEEFLPLAEAGDAEAQHKIGYLYSEGLGRPADPFRAIEWYEKAAEQGLEKSQKHLVLVLADMKPASEYYYLAIKWLYILSHNGDEEASLVLSKIREHSDEMEAQYFEGVEAARKERKRGEDLARRWLQNR